MNGLIFDWSAVGNMAIGALVVYAGKLVWQRYGSNTARVTPDGCSLNQKTCRVKMLDEWYAFKLELKNKETAQEDKMQLGDDNFTHLNLRLDRANTLLEAMITIQLELCRNTPNIDCEDLTRILVQQGIEVGSLKMRGKQ